MLVLSRRLNEKILLPSIHTSVEVLDIKGDRVRLGIEAPASVTILREELAARQAAEGGPSATANQSLKRSAPNRAAAPPQPAMPLDPAALEAAQALVRRHRHQFRNHLNSATIGIALVQRQLQAGMLAQAEATLSKISDGVHQMTDQLELVIVPPVAPVANEASSAGSARKGPPKALLVEDDHNECELLAGFFRLAGYQVATAGDGSDAIEYLHQHERPDVMLLDMMLPRCDGPTTIRRLRDDPAFNDLKIYAMSGYTPDQIGLDCSASGVARWFQKPLNPELLLREMNATRLESVAV
ncbi:MAG TPA: response regulator [Pirellulales bacterium]|jgi:carbon storage regulator CsrA|nr:response regulator [Pirellulales bacterium]